MKTLLLAAILILQGCSQKLPTLSGDFEAAEYAGQWLLINYWATWCKPCYEEIPDLNQLDQENSVKVLGVHFDAAQGEELRQAVAEMGIKFEVLLADPSDYFAFTRPNVLPGSYLINPLDGEVRVLKGKQTEHELRAYMGL